MLTNEPSIFGKLQMKTGSIGLWSKPKYYFLVQNHLLVSESSDVNLAHLQFDIFPSTKIELLDSKKNPYFIIDSKFFFKSNPAEVYSWVYELRNSQNPVHISLNQFRIISVLGRGFFGKVMLVEKLDTGVLYALKSIKKKKLQEINFLKSVVNERNILGSLEKNPFTISLDFTFQTDNKFYFGLEYASGGELLSYLRKFDVMPMEDLKIYIAEISIALNSLHKQQIIYRDLKSDNVLLGSDGHIKLIDFGLSKKLKNGRTKSFVGNQEHLAPEIILGQGYSFEVDWWSLGVFLYEIMYEETPFFDENQKKLFDNIVNKDPLFPKFGNLNTRDLIRDLLQKNPAKRLNFEKMKFHPFFKRLDWSKVENCQVQPPSFTKKKNEFDFENFDSTFVDEPPLDSQSQSTNNNIINLEGFTLNFDSSFHEIHPQFLSSA